MLYHILSDDVKAVEWIRAETLLIVKRLNSSASSSSSSQWLKRSATLLQHLFVGDRQCQQVALVDDHQLHHRPQTMADKDSHQKLEYFHSFFFFGSLFFFFFFFFFYVPHSRWFISMLQSGNWTGKKSNKRPAIFNSQKNAN